MKRILLFALASGIMFLPVSAKDRTVHDPDYTNTETILHAWSWNFPTIAANMKNIADAGFTIISQPTGKSVTRFLAHARR